MSALVFVTALLAGWALTRAARAFALRRGLVAHPNPIVPDHRTAVAYLGGVGILGGSATGVAVAVGAGVPLPLSIAVGAVLFTVLGLVDDLWPLSPRAKLTLQTLAATVAVGVGELAGPSLVPNVSGIPAFDSLLVLGWILVLVNALNLVDVCDGLAAAVGATIAGLHALSASPLGPLAAAVCGGCLGFFLLNRPPARIYMGDAGSHLLGFVVAVLSVTAAGSAGADAPLVVGLLAAVPLFELGFLVAVRLRKGLPVWRGSPDHFALRLQVAGWSKPRILAAATLGTAAAWLTGVSLPSLPPSAKALVLLTALGLAGAAAAWLRRHEVVA